MNARRLLCLTQSTQGEFKWFTLNFEDGILIANASPSFASLLAFRRLAAADATCWRVRARMGGPIIAACSPQQVPVGWHSLFTWHDLAFLSLRSFLCYSSKCAPRASVCPLQATVQTCSKESLAACSSLTSSAASARWRSLRQPFIYQLRHPLFQRRRNQGKIFTHTD